MIAQHIRRSGQATIVGPLVESIKRRLLYHHTSGGDIPDHWGRTNGTNADKWRLGNKQGGESTTVRCQINT